MEYDNRSKEVDTCIEAINGNYSKRKIPPYVWYNNESGYFQDFGNDCVWRFVETIGGIEKLSIEERKTSKVIATGFVGYLIKHWGEEKLKIYAGCLKMRYNYYNDVTNQFGKRDVSKEFYDEYMPMEKGWVKDSKAILGFVSGDTGKLIEDMIEEYFKYVDNQIFDKRKKYLNFLSGFWKY